MNIQVATRVAIPLIIGLLVAIAPPAHAALTWQTGTKLAKSPSFVSFDGPGGFVTSKDWGGGTCPSQLETTGYVRMDGDYLYVKDECSDGRSAVVRIYDIDNKTYGRVCRNSSGKGTWVVCNFNWAEPRRYHVQAGVYNASTGYLRWDQFGSVNGRG